MYGNKRWSGPEKPHRQMYLTGCSAAGLGVAAWVANSGRFDRRDPHKNRGTGISKTIFRYPCLFPIIQDNFHKEFTTCPK